MTLSTGGGNASGWHLKCWGTETNNYKDYEIENFLPGSIKTLD